MEEVGVGDLDVDMEQVDSRGGGDVSGQCRGDLGLYGIHDTYGYQSLTSSFRLLEGTVPLLIG